MLGTKFDSMGQQMKFFSGGGEGEGGDRGSTIKHTRVHAPVRACMALFFLYVCTK